MKILYFIYAIKRTNYRKLFKFIKYVSILNKKSEIAVVIDILKDFFKYNTLFLDYFYFRFFEKNAEEKEKYIDTLSMYNFQKKYNNRAFVKYFADKLLFYNKFKPYVKHNVHSLTTFEGFEQWMYENKPQGIVCKNRLGQVGSNIKVYDVELINDKFVIGNKSVNETYQYLRKNKLNLVEERIKQHDVLEKIYADSLNTLRVITFLRKSGEVEILGTILRIGYDKSIDNFDAGGISVVVELEGFIDKLAVIKSPIINEKYEKHPKTNVAIRGVHIPYWKEAIELVKNAAKEVPEVRTIGWDVVITNEGVSLLEGNHNWDKTHWQLSYRKGFKSLLNILQ